MYRVLLAVAVALTPWTVRAGTVSQLLLHPPGPQPAASVSVRASVRFAAPPTAADLEALEAAGAELRRTVSGRPAQMGRVVAVRVPRRHLASVGAVPGVVSVEPADDVSAPADSVSQVGMIGAPFVWYPPPPEEGTLGEGVVLGLFDDGCEVIHPAFFLPDAGVYDFEDTTGDGILGVGDRVDLDGDGTFESPLSRLPSYATAPVRVGRDWLYVDVDGDGRWSHGAADGFHDDDPAFGEPIFALDDVNGDDVITPGERLVRLGTSKVRALVTPARTYLRGVDLSAAPPVVFSPDPTTNDEHCTLTLGLLVGGWPGLTDVVGVAPGSEVVVAETYDVTWALPQLIDLGATVHLYEFCRVTRHADGTANDEVAISDAVDQGYVEVTPTGNLAGQEKAIRLEPLPAEPTALELEITEDGRETLWLNLVWRGALLSTAVDLVLPDGARWSWPGEPWVADDLGPYHLEAWAEETSRSAQLRFRITPLEGASLPTGRIGVELAAVDDAVPLLEGTVWAGSWRGGVRWLDADRLSDVGTALTPSTADRTLAIGAWEGGLGLLYYSGRGPRIDGAPVVDLVAPTNVLSYGITTSHDPRLLSFGGTSAAGPHAAAGAALLRSARPGLGGIELESLLTSHALYDASMDPPPPNEGVGAGLLSLDAALYGERRPWSAPPTIRLEVEGTPRVGGVATVRAEVDDPDQTETALQVRWDVGYDRVYDGPYGEARVQTFVPSEAGTVPVVAEVVDSTGQTARGLVLVEVAPAEGGTDGGVADAGSGDAGATDAGAEDGGATDGGPTDGGAVDAGPADGGPGGGGLPDGGAEDGGGGEDAGPADGGPVDAGTAKDGGPVDGGGAVDAGATDGGPVDAGASADGGLPDGGDAADAGVDAGAADGGSGGEVDAGAAGANPPVEEDTGCGCTATGPSAVAPWALLALVFGGLRLRRRRGRPTRGAGHTTGGAPEGAPPAPPAGAGGPPNPITPSGGR